MKRKGWLQRLPRFGGILEELESRLLFNADVAALTGIDPAASTATPPTVTPEVQVQPYAWESDTEVQATTQIVTQPVELVFVDRSVKDAQDLIASIIAQQDGTRPLEIHWLDSSRDGAEQISQVLQGRQDIAALHIISHGSDGALQLGATILDADTLSAHAGQLAAWGQSLTAEADLLIYGCDVAATADGQRFLADVALLTGADVAGSTDDTGARALGGDWELEFHAGQIDTASLIQQPAADEWQGLLGITAAGGETRAHTATGGTTEATTTNRQIATDSSGNFVAVWRDGTNLRAQRFNADGTVNGGVITVTNTGAPANAQVAMNANGAFVVTWNNSTGSLFFRTYTNAGVAGAITTVAARSETTEGYPFYSSTVTTTHTLGTVGINSAGEFVVAWREFVNETPDVPWVDTTNTASIKWRAYTAAGALQGSNNAATVSGSNENITGPSIAMNGTGAFVVSYTDSSGDIYARRYSAARAVQGAVANVTGTGSGTQSSAAMDSTGNYVIAYNESGVIKFRMYNSAGTATTGNLTANSIAAGSPNSPSASMDANGNFTLTWQNAGVDGGGNGVYIRTFNSSGVAAAADARVNTTTAGNQQAASVAVTPTGTNAIALWSGNGTGDAAGVFFQRYNFANAPPTLTATGSNPSFTEAAGLGTQAAAVNVYSGAAVNTVEAGQTITSLTFSVSGIADGASERLSVDGTALTLGANSAGTTSTNGMGYTVTIAGNTATIVLSSAGGISSANTQTLVNGITYQNTATDTPTAGNRVFTLTQVKDNGGTADGGNDTTALAVASTVSVVARNDGPTLSTTALSPTFTEAAGAGTQAAAVNVFSGTSVSTVESGQVITSLTFTLSGIVNGASERIVVDGTTITLGANSAGTTSTNGMTYNVSITGGTATVTLTKVAGISAAATQTLVDAITYQNTSTDNPTAGNRVFTLTQIKDNGGALNGGSDTTALSSASTVSVVAVNDAPTLSATAQNPSFTESVGLGTQASAVNVFSGTSISTVEASQTLTSLTFTITGIIDGANERIVVNGTTITLGANATGTTATNAMGYTLTVAGGNATLTLTRPAGISIANMQTLVNGITYQNTSTDNPSAGSRIFTITQLVDSGGTANGGNNTSALSVTSTVTVVPVNDGPTAVDDVATVEVATSADIAIKTNDSDPDNTTASLTITIVSFSAGIDNVTVNPDGTIRVEAGGVIGDETVVYRLTDGNGLQSANATLTVSISASSPPSGTNGATTAVEDGSVVLTAGDFGFVPVSMAQTFDGIRVSVAPALGTLRLNGVALVNGSTVSLADIDAGLLVYTPATNGNGTPYTSFTFQVRDNFGTYATTPNTLTVNVTAVNDAPILTGDNDFTSITEDDTDNPGLLVSSLITSTDVENGATNGIAIHSLTSSRGTWQYSINGGADWSDIGAVSGNAALLLSASDYVRFIPDGQNADAASLSFYAWDTTTGAAGSTADASARGGATAFSSASGSSSITITAVNDAPVLTSTSDFTPITEDQTSSAGQLVSSIIGTNDVDTGALGGIALDSVSAGNGTWQYSTDNGDNWNDVGAVSSSSALLLRSTDMLRFVPDSQNADTASIGFRAWDQTSGAAGNKVDASTNGDATAFSIGQGSANITVTAINDAPVIGAVNNVDPITEDDTDNAGQLVSTLLSSTDVDDGANSGIAIHGQSVGNGSWQYSTDDGASWNTLAAVSDTTALLLRSTDRLRFVPDGLNADNAALDFYAWDQTTGAHGTQVDASTRGTTTAFSAVGGTANLTVNAVNDAPLLSGANAFSPITEDATNNSGQLVSSLVNASDVDAGAALGVAIHSQTPGNGTWQYSTDGGATWADVGAVSGNAALLLAGRDHLRFVPDGQNADNASISFYAWDESAGVAGTREDVSTRGDTTALSNASGAAIINVSALNDAPVLTGSTDFNAITEDDTNNAGQLVSSIVGSTDVDTASVMGIAIHGQSAGNGRWQYSIDNGGTWADIGTVSDASARLLRSTDLLRFIPDGENADTASLSIYAWDQTTGSAGSLADASTRGGTTAFSSATGTTSLTVTGLNDAPVIGVANDFTSITEDQTSSAGQAVSAILGATDADTGALRGIAIHTQSPGNGTWQYSTNGGTNWADVGTVSTSSSLLLRSTDLLRFVPDGLNADAASLSFQAWDQTSGAAGSKVDTGTSGGTTAFSTGSATSSITVTAVNDAPVLNGANDLTSISEDDTDNAGTRVSTLVNNQIDNIDAGALTGIAIIAIDNSNGTWQYTTNGGSTWTAIGNVSNASALLLSTDANTSVRFVPDDNWSGTATITFRAWDRSTGSEGSTADASIHGGTTAFSAADATASLAITSANDAPVLTGSSNFTTITEDDITNPGQLVSTMFTSTDIDTGAISGIAIHGQSPSNGTWQYSMDGNTWQSLGTVSDTSARLLRATDFMRFVPDGLRGETATLSFYAWDQVNGAAGDMADASLRGGTHTYSLDSATVSIIATSVNDAPTLNPTPLSAVASPFFTWRASDMLDAATDVDGDPVSIRIIDGPTQGALELQADGGYRYVTNIGYVGSDSFTYQAWDGQEGSIVVRRVDVQAVNMLPVPPNTGPGSGGGNSGTPIIDEGPGDTETTPPPGATTPGDGSTSTPANPMPPLEEEDAAEESVRSITDIIAGIRGNAGAGQASNDLLFQKGNDSLLSYYAVANAALPTGGASVLQLLELIKSNLPSDDRAIDLQITPLSGQALALPSSDSRSGRDGGISGDQLISLPKAASLTTGLGLSIGTVWWTARVSGLLTSIMLSAPAWRSLDPLPVITSPHDDDPEYEGSRSAEDNDVEHLFDADQTMEEDLPLIR